MAKDAGGHGSEGRGGASGVQAVRLGDPRTMHNAIANAVGEPPAHSSGVAQIGTEGTNSRELRLYADNHADLNRQSMQPIRDNLGKKMDKGVYDSAKATTLWGYHADRAAQAYTKEHGGSGNKSFGSFSPADRREAATHWEADQRGDIKSGSSRTYKGK
jgi:hypothetical protein